MRKALLAKCVAQLTTPHSAARQLPSANSHAPPDRRDHAHAARPFQGRPRRGIRFVGFGSSSLDFAVFAYVRETDFGEHLKVAEDLNLRIMDMVAAAGSSFAFPSQTTYLDNGAGLDADRARDAERQIAARREAGTLDLPRFAVASEPAARDGARGRGAVDPPSPERRR